MAFSNIEHGYNDKEIVFSQLASPYDISEVLESAIQGTELSLHNRLFD